MVDMRYNSQCILVFSSTTIIPKKRAHARFCVIETVFLNYLFVTAPLVIHKKEGDEVDRKHSKRRNIYG